MNAESSTAESDMYCRQCAYNLGGLTENRCPECGKGFDPTDATSYDTKGSRLGGRLLVAACVGFVAIVTSFLFAGLQGAVARRAPGTWSGYGSIYLFLLLTGYITEVSVCCVSAVRLVRGRKRVCRRGPLVAAAAISSLVVFSCIGFMLVIVLLGITV